jgi:hypothetical protein
MRIWQAYGFGGSRKSVTVLNMARDDFTLIRDTDLLAELEKARGTFIFDVTAAHLVNRQQKRDAEAEAAEKRRTELAAMPRDQRRRSIVREVIETEPVVEANMRYLHSVMANCPFPYRRPAEGVTTYERKQGRMSMVLESGYTRTPDGQRERQSLPWGPKARLIMTYFTTQALIQGSPRIEIADSFRGFMRDVGFEPTGGPRGNIKPFKEQLLAVSAARVEMSSWDGRQATTVEQNLFKSRQVWFDVGNIDQRTLWPSYVEWNSEIFAQLQKHAMPLDVRALRAFRNSCRKLDLYAWLAYRLHGMQSDVTLPWEAVRKQFGEGFERTRDFRKQFLDDLAAVREVFPKVPLLVSERGLTLQKADTGALLIPHRKASKKR